MYRLLKQSGQLRERRDQLTHPPYRKPELLATGPNQLWSWDITKLRGPAKWTYYYLYVILDVFSRYVVGWMLAPRESAELAKRLIGETCRKFDVPEGQLTIHADRGSSMTSKPVAFLLADLGVTKTHSRPHVSDDNPYSESQFRTMKYRPEFPDRFGSIQDGRAFCQRFFPWYNDEHRHSGIGLLTPATLHFGLADQAQQQRQTVLSAAYQQHPERFVRRPPRPFVNPQGGLDQQATRDRKEYSVISQRRCLKVVDTRRYACDTACRSCSSQLVTSTACSYQSPSLCSSAQPGNRSCAPSSAGTGRSRSFRRNTITRRSRLQPCSCRWLSTPSQP